MNEKENAAKAKKAFKKLAKMVQDIPSQIKEIRETLAYIEELLATADREKHPELKTLDQSIQKIREYLSEEMSPLN